MQEIVFDALSEHIARRSVPVREDTPEGALLFDEYAFDSLGREIEHATPWGLHVLTSYEGKQVKASDSLGKLTVADHDALGRPVSVLDAAQGSTLYTYGPFGFIRSVTDPGGALTVTTRDALGRVRQLDDPDRAFAWARRGYFIARAQQLDFEQGLARLRKLAETHKLWVALLEVTERELDKWSQSPASDKQPFADEFEVEFKTTSHLLTPFMAGLSFVGARALSRAVPHKWWRHPFGNLVMISAKRR